MIPIQGATAATETPLGQLIYAAESRFGSLAGKRQALYGKVAFPEPAVGASATINGRYPVNTESAR